MKLTELFDSKPELQIVTNDSSSFAARAAIDGKIMRFLAFDGGDDEDTGIWHVEFAEVIDSSYKFNKTNTGKEFKVFSFVVACMKELMSNVRNIERLVLSAEGDNRLALYTRMLKHPLLSGYQLETDRSHESYKEHGGGLVTLVRKK